MAETIVSSRIPVINVKTMIDMLVESYQRGVNNGFKSTRAAKMFWGPPGVGKSQGIFGFAKKLAKVTGLKVVVTDCRLVLFSPVDLRGIPTKGKVEITSYDKNGNEFKEEIEVAKWLRPQVFMMDASPETINILFLDEISNIPLSTQSAAYQIVLDKKIGEHKLPDNCIVLAAGNRITDKSASYKMSKALANRMMHFEIETTAESWATWAINAGIDSRIIAYVQKMEMSVLFDKKQFNESDDLAFATPRSWEMVDNILKDFPDVNDQIGYSMMASTIGYDAATKFKAFTSVFSDLPSIKDICEGKLTKMNEKVSSRVDLKFAFSSALSSHLSTLYGEYERKVEFAESEPNAAVIKDKLKKDFIKTFENAFGYFSQFPVDFCVLIIKNVRSIDGMEDIMSESEDFIEFVDKHQEILF